MMFRFGGSPMGYGGGGFRRRGSLPIALVLVAVALVSYCSSQEINPVTGEKQYLALSQEQEIALGLESAPQMAAQHGGLDKSAELQARVDAVGQRLLQRSAAGKTPWNFDFHLLADRQTVNAFALPGGQIFITRALYERMETEAMLAGVLGHEIGHVIARHSAQQIAKSMLTQQLAGAAGVAAGDHSAAMMAQMVGQAVNMKYGRDDELESDALGVRFMSEAGYDPRALIKVMKVLAGAGPGQRAPEFFSTHPNPENREQRILEAIDRQFPQGVPQGLVP